MSSKTSFLVGIFVGSLLLLLGMQAEPISGTLGIILGSLFLLASIVGWTKSNSGS